MGWLLGLHNILFNARNLEAVIEQLSEFKDIPLEVCMEPILTKRGSAKNFLKNKDGKDAKAAPPFELLTCGPVGRKQVPFASC
jgi:hypothetical protein